MAIQALGWMSKKMGLSLSDEPDDDSKANKATGPSAMDRISEAFFGEGTDHYAALEGKREGDPDWNYVYDEDSKQWVPSDNAPEHIKTAFYEALEKQKQEAEAGPVDVPPPPLPPPAASAAPPVYSADLSSRYVSSFDPVPAAGAASSSAGGSPVAPSGVSAAALPSPVPAAVRSAAAAAPAAPPAAAVPAAEEVAEEPSVNLSGVPAGACHAGTLVMAVEMSTGRRPLSARQQPGSSSSWVVTFDSTDDVAFVLSLRSLTIQGVTVSVTPVAPRSHRLSPEALVAADSAAAGVATETSSPSMFNVDLHGGDE